MSETNSRRARIISLGACAVCAQTLFIREILGIVTGTELTLGLALASWLFWTGTGGLLLGRFLRPGSKTAARVFPGLSVSLALSVPLIVLSIRAGRSILVDPPGSIPDILPAAVLILLSMAPFGLLYGAVYNSASAVVRKPGDRLTTGISAAYMLEAAGSVAGGLLLSLLLFAFLTQLAASFAVSVAVTAVFFVTSSKSGRAGWAAALLIAAFGFAAAPRLDRASMSKVFRGYEVMEIVPSRYAELCVTRDRETISVFSGGARLLSQPDPEAVGENVQIPLLAHADPSSVLIIGGGDGGMVDEALMHPGIERVDWIELDGRLPETADRLAGRSMERAGARLLTGDGRFMLRRPELYDVIIVNIPEPASLRWNRYFTREFFESARQRLTAGGILSVRHASSENFITAENAAVLAIIRETLGIVFEHVDAVPGGTVFFIASDAPVDIGVIPERLIERGLEGRLLVLDALAWRITNERRDDLAAALAGARPLVNSDPRPILVSRELVLDALRSGRSYAGFLEAVMDLPPWALPAALLAGAILIGILTRSGSAAEAAVFLTGACSMTVQISLMLAYQAFSGILYYSLAILTALFMAGAALGAFATGARGKKDGKRLAALNSLMALTALMVPAWLWIQASAAPGQSAGSAGFMLMSLAGGMLTGAYYRTAVETAWPASGGAVPALFYSWDLFGACAGGMIAGTLLFPLSGLFWTASTAAAVHATTALILTRKIVPGRV